MGKSTSGLRDQASGLGRVDCRVGDGWARLRLHPRRDLGSWLRDAACVSEHESSEPERVYEPSLSPDVLARRIRIQCG